MQITFSTESQAIKLLPREIDLKHLNIYYKPPPDSKYCFLQKNRSVIVSRFLIYSEKKNFKKRHKN